MLKIDLTNLVPVETQNNGPSVPPPLNYQRNPFKMALTVLATASLVVGRVCLDGDWAREQLWSMLTESFLPW